MELQPTFQPRSRREASGVTLLEIMVTITLMTVIVLGLYAMFNQTQQALRDGTTQVDVLDNARAVGGLLMGELEQARSTGYQEVTNRAPGNVFVTNLWINYSPLAVPITNLLVDGVTGRTNVLHHVFFLTKKTEWQPVAYLVGLNPPGTLEDSVLFTNGVGALFRYEPFVGSRINDLDVQLDGRDMFYSYMTNFQTALINSSYLSTNYHLVCRGVVSFRLDAFDVDGNLLSGTLPYAATNTQMPAYLEMELGILEPHVLEQARALAFSGNTNLSRQYLNDQGSKIHMFRQRIPIRSKL